MELNSFKCPACDKQFELASLAKHCSRAHNIDPETLYLVLFCDGIRPTCECGCKGETKFYGATRGYSKFVPGHQARVNNNWGHNKKALDKSHETCRQLRAAGELEVWNKGLTKETNQSVVAYGLGTSKSFTKEKRERYSKVMSINRQTGIVRSPRGSEHDQWKGGVSALQNVCRSYLHAVWVSPHLRRANFKCERCSSTKELNVHHSGERFADIVRTYALQFDWKGNEDDLEKKVLISEAVARHHVEKDVPGIVVCHDCHVKIHEELGEKIN
jgi:hypothetical protein